MVTTLETKMMPKTSHAGHFLREMEPEIQLTSTDALLTVSHAETATWPREMEPEIQLTNTVALLTESHAETATWPK
jgi:hypothetical protein